MNNDESVYRVLGKWSPLQPNRDLEKRKYPNEYYGRVRMYYSANYISNFG
jgi:hypothetical protein